MAGKGREGNGLRRARGTERFRFYAKMTASSLLRRRSRMIAALLAVAIGATILSGLITISYDIPRQMGQEFRSYGTNFVIIPAGDETSLSMEKVREAVAYLPAENLTGAAPFSYRMVKINEQPFMAVGTVLREARKTSPYWLVNGSWPEKAGEALIGQEVATAIRLLPGSPFTVNGTGPGGNSFSRDFTVSGILQSGGAEEAFVYMSLEDFEGMVNQGASPGGGSLGMIDVVECSVSLSSDALEGIAEQIRGAVPGVSPRLVKRVTDSEGAVLTKLQALIFLVTAVVLLLIMICVATTMMAVIAERRREIGLRKALGASNKSLVAEFLGEGVFLGSLGGLLGAVFGYLFAQGVGLNVFNRSIAFQPLLLPLTLLASALITGIACIIPVRKAVDVDPAIVLRGE